MGDAAKLVFPSYVQTTYDRKAIGVLRQIYPDILRLMSEGVTREQIYDALKMEPYSLDIKWRYFTTALSRLKEEYVTASNSKGVVKKTTSVNKNQALPQASNALKGLGTEEWKAVPNDNVMGEPLDD